MLSWNVVFHLFEYLLLLTFWLISPFLKLMHNSFESKILFVWRVIRFSIIFKIKCLENEINFESVFFCALFIVFSTIWFLFIFSINRIVSIIFHLNVFKRIRTIYLYDLLGGMHVLKLFILNYDLFSEMQCVFFSLKKMKWNSYLREIIMK